MNKTPQPPKLVTIVNCGKTVGVELLTLRGLQSPNWLSSAGYSLALLSIGVIFPSAPVHAIEPTQAGLDFSLSASLPSAVPVNPSANDTATSDTTSDTIGNTANTTAISPLEIPSQAIAPPLGKADANQILPPPPPILNSETQVAADPSGLIQPEGLDSPRSPNPTDQGNLDQSNQTTNVNLSPNPPQAIAAVLESSAASITVTASQSLDAPVSPADLASNDGALNFALNLKSRPSSPPDPLLVPLTTVNPSPASPPEMPPIEPLTETLPANIEAMFEGDENSQVAIAIGSAEGTRTPDGGKTPAYHGHVDPGNGVWNLGSFSYQHGAKSPEDADQRQLKRLTTQAQQLYQAAQTQGLALSPQEFLNGLDLANQSPAAALSRGGYIDRLLEAHQMGLQGEEAIAWARTRSFLDPDSQQWNAPGLGNTVEQISHDQERRMQAIAQAFILSNTLSSNWNRVSAPHPFNHMPRPSSDTLESRTQVIEQLLRLDLPSTY